MEKKKIKIAIAMSGGVDSSVAAKILIDQGFEVVGFMMKLWSDPSCPTVCSRENACCDDQGVLDAKKVADQIGIPFYLVNAKEAFKKEVVDYFVEEYKNLRTPNPCLVCNEKIKFGWLLDFAKQTGCDFLATGHYARIVDDSGNPKSKFLISKQFLNSKTQKQTNYQLLCGKDTNKDQSYFLYRLNQKQLSQIILPVGEFTKTEVRAMAKNWKLPVFEKRESQEICFIQDKDFREFLRRNIPAEYFKSGDIVNKEGNVLGQHEGLINYTIGQRRGVEQSYGLQITKSKLQISNKNQNSKCKKDKQPLYVTGFDIDKNRLIVGEDKEVYKKEMTIKDVHFIQNNEFRIMSNEDIQVKIRYRHAAVNCIIKKTDNRKQITVEFREKQRAITPGQSAVFYIGDEVLGGGTIIG